MRRGCDRSQQGRRRSGPVVTSSGIIEPRAHRDGLDAVNPAQQHLIGLLGTQRQVSAIAQDLEGRLLAGSECSRASLTADLGRLGPGIESQLRGAASYPHCRPLWPLVTARHGHPRFGVVDADEEQLRGYREEGTTTQAVQGAI